MPGAGKFIAKSLQHDQLLYDDEDFPDRRVWIPVGNLSPDMVERLLKTLPYLETPKEAEMLSGLLDEPEKKCFYLIGSLRDPRVPELANRLEASLGCEIFCDWFAAGKIADDSWQDYQTRRNRNYVESLQGPAALHVFDFDHYHLNRSCGAILLGPAGGDCRLELGYIMGQGKPGFLLLDKEPERWGVMPVFCFHSGGGVFMNEDDLIKAMKKYA